MSENFEKVIAAINYLGLKPNIGEYKWRFLIQKITYLAQTLGISTDYDYTPYIAGPYSPALTRDYFNQSEALTSLQSSYELTDSDIRHLNIIREFIDLEGNLSLLETTSTIVYIMNDELESDDDEIFIRSKVLKPHISETLLIIGMTKAKQLLFKEEYLTEELKAEMDAWEKLE